MSAATVSAVDAVIGAASMMLAVREVPPNRGRVVEAIQAFAGGQAGEPWCADFVYYVGAHTLGADRWPLPKTSACDTLLAFAKAQLVLRERPARGNVFLVLRTDTDAVHTGFVSRVMNDGSWRTIEGNSNELGERDGIGVFANTRGTQVDRRRYVFVDWISLVRDAPA